MKAALVLIALLIAGILWVGSAQAQWVKGFKAQSHQSYKLPEHQRT